ncbi:hypothetical protein JCM8547_001094 [Rhodosporidiobolus lusitaniae]
MHSSPQIALAECLVSLLLLLFVVFWVLAYDRHARTKVLRSKYGDEAGARARHLFKRSMICFYLLGLACFAIQGGWYAAIKYELGFLPANMTGNPLPRAYWPQHYQSRINPLQMLYATAWGSEIVVHLEELLFFYHLINTTISSRPWFQSVQFKLCVAGSFLGFAATLGITGAFWHDPGMGDAIMTLITSVFVLVTSVAFVRVMVVFPTFLAQMKSVGGTNEIRIPARLVFGTPLFILAVDGLTSEQVLNSHVFWVDLGIFLALFGFAVQAVVTLLIFLPRDWADELEAKDAMSTTRDSTLDPARRLRSAIPFSRKSNQRAPVIISAPQLTYSSSATARRAMNKAAAQTGSTGETLELSYSDWPVPPSDPRTSFPPAPSPFTFPRRPPPPPPPPPPSSHFIERFDTPLPPLPSSAFSSSSAAGQGVSFLDTTASSSTTTSRHGQPAGYEEAEISGGAGGKVDGVLVKRETEIAVVEQGPPERQEHEIRRDEYSARVGKDGRIGTRGQQAVEHEEGVSRWAGDLEQGGMRRRLPDNWKMYSSPIEIV